MVSPVGARDVAIAGDGSLWLLVGTRIVHRSSDGGELPGTISDAGTPSSVAVAPDGSLGLDRLGAGTLLGKGQV